MSGTQCIRLRTTKLPGIPETGEVCCFFIPRWCNWLTKISVRNAEQSANIQEAATFELKYNAVL